MNPKNWFFQKGMAALSIAALLACAPSQGPHLTAAKSQPVVKAEETLPEQNLDVAHDFFLRARQHELNENHALALSFFQIAQEYDSDSRDLCFIYTDKLKAAGQIDSALAMGLRCLKLKGAPTSPEYQALAEIYLRKNEIRPALDFYHRALKLNEDDKDLLYTIATLYEGLKDIPKHVLYTEKLLPKADFPERLVEKQVQNYRSLRKVDAIPKLYQAAWDKTGNPTFGEKLAAFFEEQEMYANLVDVTRKLYRENIDEDHYGIQKARAFILAGQIDSAFTVYEALLRKNPEESEFLSPYAALLYDKGRFGEAQALFQKLIRLEPDNPVFHFFLGSVGKELKERDSAEIQLKKAIELDAKVPDYWAKLATLYIEAGQEQKALDLLKKMGEGKDWYAHYVQGMVFTQIARKLEKEKKALADSNAAGAIQNQSLHYREKGIESFRQSLTLENQNRRVLFELSVALEQVNKRSESIEILKKLVIVDSSDATVLNYLGYMLVEENQELEYAGSLIEKALKLEPDNGAFLDSKGWFFYQTNDFTQAQKYIQLALERIPHDTTILEHFALILEKLGQGDAAIEKWQLILQLDPEHKLALSKLKKG